MHISHWNRFRVSQREQRMLQAGLAPSDAAPEAPPEGFEVREPSPEEEAQYREQQRQMALDLAGNTNRRQRGRIRDRLPPGGNPPAPQGPSTPPQATDRNGEQPALVPQEPPRLAPTPDVQRLLSVPLGGASRSEQSLQSAANTIVGERISQLSLDRNTHPSVARILRSGRDGGRMQYIMNLYERGIEELQWRKQNADGKIQGYISGLESFGFRLTRRELTSSELMNHINERLRALQNLRSKLSTEMQQFAQIRQRDEEMRTVLLQTGRLNAEEIDIMLREHVLGIRPMDERLHEYGIDDIATVTLVRRIPRKLGWFRGRAATAESLDINTQVAINYVASRILATPQANPSSLEQRLANLLKSSIGQAVRIYSNSDDLFQLGIMSKENSLISLKGRGKTAELDTASKRIRINGGQWHTVETYTGTALPNGTVDPTIPSFRLGAALPSAPALSNEHPPSSPSAPPRPRMNPRNSPNGWRGRRQRRQ